MLYGNLKKMPIQIASATTLHLNDEYSRLFLTYSPLTIVLVLTPMYGHISHNISVLVEAQEGLVDYCRKIPKVRVLRLRCMLC